MTQEKWIEMIAPLAQNAMRRFGYLASVLIAQTCQENGYGMDESCIELLQANNIMGMKKELLNDTWRSDYWHGLYIIKLTPEWYGGNLTHIKDMFRKYDSMQDCLYDYCQFVRDARRDDGSYKYRDVLGITDPGELIRQVRIRGYCTDPTYDYNVVKIISKWNLTQYDKENTDMGITINRDYITTNNSNSTNNPEYIVIHNTDNFDRGADAKAHASGLHNGDMDRMSWHYVTDDGPVAYQCIEHNRGAWHVGKNYGSNNLFGTVNNRNSICIEMCVNAGYDYEKAFQNTVKLTRHLMQQLSIPAERVLQHWDVCSKDCPSQIREHGDWDRFKALLTSNEDDGSKCMIAFETIGKNDTGEDVGTLQTMLKQKGYKNVDGTELEVDKSFGDNTDYAVKCFQEDNDLTPDGYCGPKTWPVVFGKE